MEQARQRTLLDLLYGRTDQAATPARQVERRMTLQDAASIFKTLGHDGRLAILGYLASGERSVNELENILDARQSAVSQQLARLRMEGMVNARREGQTIFYSIKDRRVTDLLAAFSAIFEYEQPSGQ